MKNRVIRCNHIVAQIGYVGYVCGNVIGIVEKGKTLTITKQGRSITVQLSDETPVTVKCECCGGITRIYAEE